MVTVSKWSRPSTSAFVIQMIVCSKYVYGRKMPLRALQISQICLGSKNQLLPLTMVRVIRVQWGFCPVCQQMPGLRSGEDRVGGLEALRSRPVHWPLDRLVIHGRELWSYQQIGFPLYYIIIPEWGLQQWEWKTPWCRHTCGLWAGRTKGASVTIVFITGMLELLVKREPEKYLFLETPKPNIVFLPIEQEMLSFKAINRHQNKELLCHWISVNLKNGCWEEPPL